MLVFNQQANIKNVNGAIADTFANRPAAQSTFYLFYSTDTQEIYYDNGAWVLLAAAGGTPVNIYNSDGTLTANRTLSGANNGLTFSAISTFALLTQNQFSFANYDANNQIVFTGQPNFEGLIQFTDFNNSTFNTSFIVGNSIIKTQYGTLNNDIGLKLDFANDIFNFGNLNGGLLTISTNSLGFSFNNQDPCITATNNYEVIIGDVATFQNGVHFIVKDANNLITSRVGGIDIGLKLDFANNLYQLGEVNGGAQGLSINLTKGSFSIDDFFTGNSNFAINVDINGLIVNSTRLDIDDINSLIKSSYQGNDIGLYLDFANGTYQFGDLSNVNNFGLLTIAGNDVLLQGGGNNPLISIENTNSLIKTRFLGNDNGVYLDFSNEIYRIGQITGSNTSQLVVDDSNEQVYTTFGGNAKGIVLDAASNIYQFGRITGGNTTYIEIADGNAYPVQISGTNVTAGTAGGASGLHLKIKINGVDYKIELRNP